MTKSASDSSGRVYMRLLRQARPYWPHLGAISLLSLLATPLALIAPLPLKIVAESVIGTRPLPHLLAVILPSSIVGSRLALLAFASILLVLTALLGHLQGLATWLLQTFTGGKLVLEFRARLFRHAQRLSFSYHDSRGAADSAYRIQYDTPAIEYILIYG